VIGNRYELGRVLGSGGFATVYEAKDHAEERVVAVKLLPLGDEKEVVERFRLEALQLSQLRSANVARVYDFGRDEEHGLYLVMERIDGVALEPKKLGRVLLAHEVLRAARALLSGLAEAHAARIVHRDIKPANVLVPGGIAGLGGLKILDFGIAQSEHRAQLESAMAEPRRTIGTPAYMAPELLMGEPSTPASDVYAAGLVLYELLGHTLLFPDRAPREQQQLRTEIEASLGGRVPPPLDAMLARMLARDPEKRFADAGAALADLVNMETAPVSVDVPASPPSRRRSMPPPHARPTLGTARLSRLDPDGTRALASTLHNLDLPMLDALARRERGSEASRVARALTLGLRLEIDAAALVLEPVSDHGPGAHALAACVLAPRARAATRARIARGLGEGSAWLETVDLALGELLVATQAAICGPEEVPLALMRSERLLARNGPRTSSRVTLELAHDALASRARGVTEVSMRAFEEIAAGDATAPPLSSVLRALLLGPLAFRIDDHVARASFERAAQLAADTGATLLEARALCSLGGMLVEVPGRLAQGVSALERVTTLLLHADAPSLEHLAAHNRGVAYIVEGRFTEAAEQLQHAREVASGEAPLELEILSGAQELSARLAAGDIDGARALAKLLELSRNVPLAPRESMLVALACTLVKWADGELAPAPARIEGAGDALLIAGVLDVIRAAGAGEPIDYLASAAELHRTAEEHGFAAFYWFDLLRAIVARVPEPHRAPMIHAVDRLVVLLGSATKA
jgi:serine/threonine-protein kinase